MKMLLRTFAVLSLLLIATANFAAEKIVYVNYSPDVRYSINGKDSKIVFNLGASGYSYGNDLGNITSCGEQKGGRCISFDFMAVADLPDGTKVGTQFEVGQYRFSVREELTVSLLGQDCRVHRVDVTKSGQPANSYLYNSSRGVIAILVPNFGNKEIPESIFFVRSAVGVLGPSEE